MPFIRPITMSLSPIVYQLGVGSDILYTSRFCKLFNYRWPDRRVVDITMHQSIMDIILSHCTRFFSTLVLFHYIAQIMLTRTAHFDRSSLFPYSDGPLIPQKRLKFYYGPRIWQPMRGVDLVDPQIFSAI